MIPFLLLLAGVGCKATNDSSSTADTSPPPDVGPFYAEAIDCPQTVAPGSDKALTRWPYVQWVTEDAATIAWGGPIDSSAGTLTASRETTVTLDVSGQAFKGSEDADFRMYHARLTDLEPGTDYCYAVSVDGVTLADGLKFRTAPASPNAPVTFMVIGDFGSGSAAQLLVRDQILAHMEGVDVMFTTGDNAYVSGTYAEFHENVFQVYQELMTRVVVYPVPGNHDYKTDDASPYLANFFLPENAWRPQDKERYYTVDWGPIHFVALDDNGPMFQVRADEFDDEVDWFDAALAANERPWPIVSFHQPLHSEHEDRASSVWALGFYEAIIDAHNVPLVLQGHNHFYERYPPLKGGEVTTMADGGTVYLTSGGGGQGLYVLDPPEVRLAGVEAHHFILGHVQGCEMTLKAIGTDGVVFDEVTLNRCE